jgi:hypothetical protein
MAMALAKHFAWQGRLPFWLSVLVQLGMFAAFGSVVSCATALLTGRPRVTTGLWHGDLSLVHVVIFANIGGLIQALARRWTLRYLDRQLART